MLRFKVLLLTHHYFKRKPPIAKAFDVKENFVRIRLRFIQNPRSSLVCCLDADVFNYRHSKIWMRFQTERKNRYDNKTHRYCSYNLERGVEGSGIMLLKESQKYFRLRSR